MINYVKGSVTDAPDNTIIAHIVNNKGGWGAGVSGAISDAFPSSESSYRMWYDLRDADISALQSTISNYHLIFPKFELGKNQIIDCSSNIVVNMLAQNGYKTEKNLQPLNMEALQKCLLDLFKFAKNGKYSVHMPKIGSGLGGGNWYEIEQLIDNISDSNGVSVTIYEYP